LAQLPVPEGTLSVAIGLLVSGTSAYLFFKLVRVGMGSDAKAEPVLQLWFLMFLLAPGFFLPVEQEVGRALAHRRALGQGGAPVVRRAGMLAGALAAVTTVGLLGVSGVIVDKLLGGSWALLLCLVLGVLGWASAHLGRGVLSGSGRFAPYGLLLAADGVLRVVAATGLLIIGSKALIAYGLVAALPPALALTIALRGQRPIVEPGPEASWPELTQNLGWLVLGSVMAAVLVNAGPIAAGLLKHTNQKALVTHFTFAVVITRVPLFMFQAVQAALLPKLARLAAQGEFEEFRAGFRKLMAIVAVVGVIGVAGALTVGPFAVRLFSPKADLSRQTVGLLALASAAYMVALAIAQAVIALHGHAKVAAGWASGVAVFVIVTALGSRSDLLLRVELGLVAGSIVADIAFAWALASLLRTGARPDPASVTEALFDMPLEP
jgi:O-antigen/teichoic acid export membrane protein